jgi:DNA-binding transcriptional MerR regulator
MPDGFDLADYRTPAQKAGEWGVRADTVRWYIRQRLIPAIRIGQRLYIHRDVQPPRFEQIEAAKR